MRRRIRNPRAGQKSKFAVVFAFGVAAGCLTHGPLLHGATLALGVAGGMWLQRVWARRKNPQAVPGPVAVVAAPVAKRAAPMPTLHTDLSLALRGLGFSNAKTVARETLERYPQADLPQLIRYACTKAA